MKKATDVGGWDRSTRSLDETPMRVIGAKVSMRQRVGDLWQRRELLTSMVFSDIRIKYKGSVLGFFWSMLSPALSLVIYYLVFSVVLRNGIPNYVIYLFSGLVVWNMFQNSVTGSTGAIVDRAGLVKKVSFPREILALSNVGAGVVYFAVQLILLGLVCLVSGHSPAWGFLWLLPISFVSLYLLTAGVSIIMSAVTVYFRDMRHLMEVAIQVWFWLTPVVYSYKNSLALRLHQHGIVYLYFLNPVTTVVLTFQRIFYATPSVTSTIDHSTTLHILPTWPMSTYFYMNVCLLAGSILLFLVALVIFGRLEGDFESEL